MKFEDILQHFPKFELSYEKIVHKKVHKSDFLLAIPESKNKDTKHTILNIL